MRGRSQGLSKLMFHVPTSYRQHSTPRAVFKLPLLPHHNPPRFGWVIVLPLHGMRKIIDFNYQVMVMVMVILICESVFRICLKQSLEKQMYFLVNLMVNSGTLFSLLYFCYGFLRLPHVPFFPDTQPFLTIKFMSGKNDKSIWDFSFITYIFNFIFRVLRIKYVLIMLLVL